MGNDSEDGVVELFKAWKSQSNEEKARIARNAEALYKRSFAVAPVAATLLKAVTLA